MFSARKSLKIGAAAMLGALFAVPSAAQAGVVVKSSGPSAAQYPVGTKLDDAATITLQDGDAITILTSGGTRVLRGEGTFRVGARVRASQSRFAALTRKRAASRVRTGAVRAGDDDAPLTSPNLWYVDVSRPATMCLYDIETVRLWRPGTEGDMTYEVADTNSPAHIHVAFADGEMIAALDKDRMPLSDGGTYQISNAEGGEAVTITFVSLDGEFATPDALAEGLIAKGCTQQLDLLATTLEEEAV